MCANVPPVAGARLERAVRGARATGGWMQNRGSRMGGRAGTRPVLTWLACALLVAAWAPLASVDLELMALVGVRAWLWRIALPAEVGRSLVFDWRLLLAVALLLALAGAWIALGRHLVRRRAPRPARATFHLLLVGLTAGAAVWRVGVWQEAVARTGVREPNRFGLLTSYPPRHRGFEQSGKPTVPAARIETNREGFRDAERDYAPRDDVHRVLVVGDSFVYGYGIAKAEDLLHARLERALEDEGGGPWEVMNLAQQPAALWYYVRALRTVHRAVHADILVMSFLRGYDLEPLELRRLETLLTPSEYAVVRAFGVDEDVMRIGARSGADAMAGDGGPTAGVRAELLVAFAHLVAEVAASGAHLIVWEPLGFDPFFAPFGAAPHVTFVGPDEVLAPHANAPSWFEDEALAYVDDGHPTPLANRYIAEHLARRIEALPGLRPLAPEGR